MIIVRKSVKKKEDKKGEKINQLIRIVAILALNFLLFLAKITITILNYEVRFQIVEFEVY